MKKSNNEEPKTIPEANPEQSGVTFNTMSKEDMDKYLKELSHSVYWQAVIKLITEYDMSIINAILSLDPLKQATDIARAQGQRVGLYYLNEYIKSLLSNIEEPSGGKD
jgi:RNA processing factor Prp31